MVHKLNVIYENVNQNIPDFSTFSPRLNVWDLMPIVILCSLTIIFTLLWLLAIWIYLNRIKKSTHMNLINRINRLLKYNRTRLKLEISTLKE